jgi:hypothetical protein
MGPFAPFLATIQPFSKARAILTYKVVWGAPPLQTGAIIKNWKKIVERQLSVSWELNPGRVKGSGAEIINSFQAIRVFVGIFY